MHHLRSGDRVRCKLRREHLIDPRAQRRAFRKVLRTQHFTAFVHSCYEVATLVRDTHIDLNRRVRQPSLDPFPHEGRKSRYE